MTEPDRIAWLGAGNAERPDPDRHGDKAAMLSRADGIGLAVPPGFVLPIGTVAALGQRTRSGPGLSPSVAEAVTRIEDLTGTTLSGDGPPLLLAVRPSVPGGRGGGLVPAVLNIGAGRDRRDALAAIHGDRVAVDLERRLVQSFGIGALGLEGDDFEYALHDALQRAGVDAETDLTPEQLLGVADACRALIRDETGAEFPEDGRAQLGMALGAMASAWTSDRARRRRALTGQPEDVPLALIVQRVAVGLSAGNGGTGTVAFRSATTGDPGLSGRFLAQSQGEEATMGLRSPQVLTAAERTERGLTERSVEEAMPAVFDALDYAGRRLEQSTREPVAIDFALDAGAVQVLDVRRAALSPRAIVAATVDLAATGVIGRDEAVLRIDPALLDDHLHPMIDPAARRDILGVGLPASPGGVCGALVFSPDAAEAMAAEGRTAILALTETGPEDIRGMHAAGAVVTVRGGMTSHAAVVARGLGKPCVVGARDLTLDLGAGRLTAADGRGFDAGDLLTVDGSTGQILAGEVATRAPELTGAFATLMAWADGFRRLGVRANADTEADAAVARNFGAAGIGLCRTEHMFFQRGRIAAMREMILAESEDARQTALDRLLPMQRADFCALFRAVAPAPVTIRLLDPPLHEFLPHSAAEAAGLAASLGLPLARIEARAAELAEFNPMLGKRGCRIGIVYPEIYRMQARAIFLAVADVWQQDGVTVRPEIMVPLVSTHRELQIVGEAVAEVATDVGTETGFEIDYAIGVMIETPRAALRAGDIAEDAGFISLGTNNLTQMLYGLSRDDAGRFMPDYLARGVFDQDPFHALDTVGVGEIMQIGIERARATRPDISVGLCGEHGGDPRSIAFCETVGVDYVSCSPFRVPTARLAAAQAAIRARQG